MVVEVEVPGRLDVLGAVVAAPPGTVVLGAPPGTDVLGTLDELVLGQGAPVVVGAVVVVAPWREEVVVVDALLVVGPAPPAEVDVVADGSVVDVAVVEPQVGGVVVVDPGLVVLVGRLGAAAVDVVDDVEDVEDVEAAADEPVAARDNAM